MCCVKQGGHGGLSEYELKRLETIRENQAFLSSINLFQVGEFSHSLGDFFYLQGLIF